MKQYELSILKAAKSDIRHANIWYNLQKENLGNEFLIEIEKYLVQIQTNPKQFPKHKNSIRKAVLRKFPYCIFFSIQSNIIKVIAVFHNSRNPITWMRRVK